MTEDKKSEKRFDRFFIIILIIAFLTVILTFTTTQIAKEEQAAQDSVKTEVDTTKIH